MRVAAGDSRDSSVGDVEIGVGNAPGGDGGSVSITAGSATSSGTGGSLSVGSGSSNRGESGDVTLFSGEASSLTGSVAIRSGASSRASSGVVTVMSGNAARGVAGSVTVAAGVSSSGVGADATLLAVATRLQQVAQVATLLCVLERPRQDLLVLSQCRRLQADRLVMYLLQLALARCCHQDRSLW